MIQHPIVTMNDICVICGKTPQSSSTRPHSLHKTKRLVRPNLGKWQGLNVCARCRKSIAKPDRVRKVNEPLTKAE